MRSRRATAPTLDLWPDEVDVELPIEEAAVPTLTEFLLARIAEDEAAAQRCQRRRATDIGLSWMDDKNEPWLLFDIDAAPSGDPVVSTLPARVLAECEAKRQVVTELSEAMEYDESIHEAISSTADAGMRVLNHLALPYADHPDYDERWRP